MFAFWTDQSFCSFIIPSGSAEAHFFDWDDPTQVRLALEVGFKGSDIFLNGCGKQGWELELAIENGCFLNVDSGFDAENICRMAELKQKIVQVDKRAKKFKA